ncbi:PKD domain-containing protein [Halorussus salilacus]|uniref:PKD domain-containing protein n=1 Tax=Halorussus salilacus TaxID=2953750 RepID=UPI0020A194E3|nr:PKD domain-containing protein [Halorussus salilacus]USZ67489.1 PKD domain-containing protein [Halorussus salilacus]
MAEHSEGRAGRTTAIRTTHERRETGPPSADGIESPVVGFEYAPSVPVAGDAVSFVAAAPSRESGRRCEWSLGDGDTAEGERVAHTYDSGGRKEVTLTVTGEEGVDSVRRSVTVYREVALELHEFERRDGDVLLPVDVRADGFGPSAGASLRLGSPAAVAMGGGATPVRTEARSDGLRAWFPATETGMTERGAKMRLAGRAADGVPLVGTANDRVEDR